MEINITTHMMINVLDLIPKADYRYYTDSMAAIQRWAQGRKIGQLKKYGRLGEFRVPDDLLMGEEWHVIYGTNLSVDFKLVNFTSLQIELEEIKAPTGAIR